MDFKLKLLTILTLLSLLAVPSLVKAHAYQANEPTSVSFGVQMLPSESGGFIQNRQASFKIEVKNTGSMGSDRYNLSWETQSPGWKVFLYDANSMTLLADTDGNGTPDTGTLVQGAVKAVLVVIKSPTEAGIGAHTTITVTAQSGKDPTRAAQSRFLSAVPTSFAQAYTDEDASIRLGLFSENSSIQPKMEGWFQGNTLTLTASPREHYLYSWEVSGNRPNGGSFTNIEYTLLDRFGNKLITTKQLTKNELASIDTWDRYPHLSFNASGYTGVAWIRTVYNRHEDKINSNVYLTILNPEGEQTGAILNITKNEQWGNNDTLHVLMFSTPRINAMEDKLVITWVQSKWTAFGEEKDVWFAVYNQQGQVLSPPAKLTSSEAGKTTFHSPNLIRLTEGRVLAAFSIFTSATQTNNIAYMVINSSGMVIIPQTIITGSSGSRVDGVHLLSGNTLLAWTNETINQISYALLNDTYSVSLGPVDLSTPGDRKSDFVSVTHDNFGNAVLTWLDAVFNNHLFYALVDGTGSLKTPPLSFYSTPNTDSYVLTSYSGQGNSFYAGGWQQFLPVVIRR
jgi:hypothetical protein